MVRVFAGNVRTLADRYWTQRVKEFKPMGTNLKNLVSCRQEALEIARMEQAVEARWGRFVMWPADDNV